MTKRANCPCCRAFVETENFIDGSRCVRCGRIVGEARHSAPAGARIAGDSGRIARQPMIEGWNVKEERE